MKLSVLLDGITYEVIDNNIAEYECAYCTADSREVKKETVFFAIKGIKHDGKEFIHEAYEKGACIIVCERHNMPSEVPVPVIGVDDVRKAYAIACANYFHNPSRDVHVIGITGTNGKTTTAYLLQHIMNTTHPCGLISTIEDNTLRNRYQATSTTPDPFRINQLLAEMRDYGVSYCAMEVSSHALDQDRVYGLEFDGVIFTNISHDHLDYHETIEEYYKAKSKLFTEYSDRKLCIVNGDCEYGQRLCKETEGRIVTFGEGGNLDYVICNTEATIDGISFEVRVNSQPVPIKSSLIGSFNAHNILAAFLYAYHEGVSIPHILEAISTFKPVSGRMERITKEEPFTVYVDYAHTPDAMEKVLGAIRGLCGARLIVLFGCGGERDRAKRLPMGRIATTYADHVIITNDNPRNEDEESILREIEEGFIEKEGLITDKIPDRSRAIMHAIEVARENDIVLILGKGHEDYIDRKGFRMFFSDQKEVEKYLSKKD